MAVLVGVAVAAVTIVPARRNTWSGGALCSPNIPPKYKQYAINESYDVNVVPTESINITERSLDIDDIADDTLPVVHAYRSSPGTFIDGVADDTVNGGHTITYTITETTQSGPDLDTLVIGTPQYGPNQDTGPRVRVSRPGQRQRCRGGCDYQRRGEPRGSRAERLAVACEDHGVS